MRDSYVQISERPQSVRGRQIQQQQLEIDSMRGNGVGTIICCFGVVFGVFCMAFIITNLIYAYQGSECVTMHVDGIFFNLATWLKVDAYTKIGIIALLLFAGFVSCLSIEAGMILMVFVIFIVLLYSLFSFVWTIVGSVLFWGKLNPIGVCQGGLTTYMYIYLIISYVAVICNGCFSKNSSDSFL